MTISPGAVGSPDARPDPLRARLLRSVLVAAVLGSMLFAGGLAAPLLHESVPAPLGSTPVKAAIPAELGPCVAGWREMPVPDAVFISTPFEVVTHRNKQAWILGGANTGLLALRWNGTRWVDSATGSSGHRGLVGGISIGDKKVLGVGYYRPYRGDGLGSLEPISGRIVSGKWRNRPVPDPPGPRATMTDVVGQVGGKAWAVGTRLEKGRLRAYAARWTGTQWRRLDPPSGTGAGLLATELTPSGALWAVGWREGSPGQPRPYAIKRVDGTWKRVSMAPLPVGTAVVTDIAFRKGHSGYAVGYVQRKGSDRPVVFLQRWDGHAWSNVGLPWAGDTPAIPRAVSIGLDGSIWIVGVQTANDKREARGFTARYLAGAWDVDVLGVPSDVRSEVLDVAATKWGGAVAAANVGASLLVLASCSETPAATAAAGGSGHQVRISNMKARRVATRQAMDHARDEVPDYAAPAAGAGLSTAGAGITSVRIAAPVPPSGFVVRDMAAKSGLAQWTRTYDGLVADFDDNGYKDVFYSRHGGIKPRLAMNGPSGFSNAAGSAFGAVDRHGCDRADVDNDGRKDIFCAVGAARGKFVERHELSLAPHSGAAELKRGALGVSDALGRGRRVGLLRLDGDAWPELFITNAPDRDDGLPGYNRFYRNVGGTFKPAPGVGLDASHGGVCVEASDVDQDGDEDLVYCTEFGIGNRPAGLRFMRNEGGTLRDRTAALGIKPMGDLDVAFADVTGDGRLDLVQMTRTLLRVSKWTRSGYQRVYQARISHAWGVAAGDASGDGRADIYIVRGSDKENLVDRLLVSRNNGKSYQSVKIPWTRKGSADGVLALDYDRNGLTDFVVLNGRKQAGPVQLLASFRS